MANCTFDLIYRLPDYFLYLESQLSLSGFWDLRWGNMKENRLKGKLDPCLDCKNSMRDKVWKQME